MRILNEKGNQKKSTYNNKNSIEENNSAENNKKKVETLAEKDIDNLDKTNSEII